VFQVPLTPAGHAEPVAQVKKITPSSPTMMSPALPQRPPVGVPGADGIHLASKQPDSAAVAGERSEQSAPHPVLATDTEKGRAQRTAR